MVQWIHLHTNWEAIEPKFCNGGYYYTIDRCGSNGRTQWSSSTLSHANSSGRAVTYDNKGPVTVITDHIHIPEPEREEGLLL